MDELEKLLVEHFKNKERHVEWILDEISEIEFVCLREDWNESGKYIFGDFDFKVKYKNDEYFVNISQTKSGSYYSDYYYNEPEISNIMTFEEYSKPKEIFSFIFRKETIKVLENNTVLINDIIFNTVEEAINYILEKGEY